jgi:glucose/arabinose dehydrogenase
MLIRTLLITIVVALAASLAVAPAQGATVPAGFTDQLVATVPAPTAIAFTPDGRGLIATQSGRLRVLTSGGTLLATPALDLSAKICANSERGLLGVAVDPAFATNGFVYLYYTFNKAGDCGAATVNRVARVTLSPANTAGSEVVLIDNIPSPAGNHNGGDLHFGKDGNLYVSVGDGGCDYAGGGCAGANDAARDRHVLLGKILRITPTGGIPADNPFQGAGTARCNTTGITTAGTWCQETYAWGLRNPYRIAFDPNAAGTRFYINDVGQGAWEEIDLGAAGADYGWNVREGFCVNGSTTNCGPPPTGMTNPLFAYGRSDGCVSITGGAFVPSGVWPAAYQGKYLFADFGCGKIFRLDPNGAGGFTRVDFATGATSIVHLAFGPVASTQALYYTTYAAGGQVRRIRSTAALSVTTAGSGSGYVDSAPAGIDCGRNLAGHTDCSEDVAQGDSVTLTARPAVGTQFAGFAGAGCTAGTPTCSVAMTAAQSVTATFCSTGALPGVVRGSTSWLLRSSLSSGAPTTTFSYGTKPLTPVMGDWDGNCSETAGTFEAGTFKLRNANSAGAADVTFQFGDPRGFPVAGDFNGDGQDDLAVYRNGTWQLRDTRSGDTNTITFGSGSWPATIPVTGDWNGDGVDGIGTYTPATGTWSVRHTATSGIPDIPSFQFGNSARYPVTGDWNGDGIDSVGVKVMSGSAWELRNANGAGAVDLTIDYGIANDLPLTWK